MQACYFINDKEIEIMKNNFRLNFIVLLLALPFILGGCGNDDDLPVARMTITERGGVQNDGNLYVENGDSICIDRISIIKDESTPTAMITACEYYWDWYYVGPAFGPDFARKFYVYNQPAGRHWLSIRMLVAAKGYSLATYVSQIPVIVQASGEDGVKPDGTDIFSHPVMSHYEGDVPLDSH